MFKSLPLIIKLIILWIPGSVALMLGAVLISSSGSEITSKEPEPSSTQSRSPQKPDPAPEPGPTQSRSPHNPDQTLESTPAPEPAPVVSIPKLASKRAAAVDTYFLEDSSPPELGQPGEVKVDTAETMVVEYRRDWSCNNGNAAYLIGEFTLDWSSRTWIQKFLEHEACNGIKTGPKVWGEGTFRNPSPDYLELDILDESGKLIQASGEIIRIGDTLETVVSRKPIDAAPVKSNFETELAAFRAAVKASDPNGKVVSSVAPSGTGNGSLYLTMSGGWQAANDSEKESTLGTLQQSWAALSSGSSTIYAYDAFGNQIAKVTIALDGSPEVKLK